ncbi:unnamed protein product [Phytomonas sp. EM1]|nr:unnamed protein product [Phytomonas sp. EM1]|eukprot:CCW64970.1 unnamed protein product [Phytomonas sp. isolate EM1]
MELFLETTKHVFTSLALDDARGRMILTSAFTGEVLCGDLAGVKGGLTVLARTDDALGGVAVDPLSGDLFISLSLARSVERIAMGAAGPPFQRIPVYANGFEGRRFTSPSALAVSPTTGELFFTDAGGEGESSITNPIGAIYRELGGLRQIVSLCASGLQQPAGIAVGPDGCVFVCERSANRLLRYVPRGNHYADSVFYRFNGSFGPTAVAVSPKDGSIFVALYEPQELLEPLDELPQDGAGEEERNNRPEGVVVVLGRDGREKGTIGVPGSQLRGVAVSKDGSTVYVLHTDEAMCVSRIYRCRIAEESACEEREEGEEGVEVVVNEEKR